MDELKPCPYCGSADVNNSKYGKINVVSCCNCPASVADFNSTKKWNTRHERQCECTEWQFWKDQMVESPDHKNVVGLDDICNYCPLCGGKVSNWRDK